MKTRLDNSHYGRLQNHGDISLPRPRFSRNRVVPTLAKGIISAMKMAETVSLSIRSVINDSNWARVKSDVDRFQARTGATPVCFAL